MMPAGKESRRLRTVRRLYECPNERYWIEYWLFHYGETEVLRPDSATDSRWKNYSGTFSKSTCGGKVRDVQLWNPDVAE